MKAGVSSRGSPMPKSMSGTPSAALRRLASVRRTKGYVVRPASVGLSLIGRLRPRAAASSGELRQHLVGAHERGDLDLLLARVGEARLARAEVDRVHAGQRELRD